MTLSNYRDVSRRGGGANAGFQFEFRCQCCSRTWTSPFKAYRKAHIAAALGSLSRLVGGIGYLTPVSRRVADFGEQRAWQSALDGALEEAESQYVECPQCDKTVCDQCWDEDRRCCKRCGGGGEATEAERSTPSAGQQSGVAGLRCPNCNSAIDSGRFCAECGFDMASTHKSCPGCGAMSARAARFCPDCGHGF